MKDFATESGHWYTQDGTPAYEVPNKSKGGMRPTRITDAKKIGLVPSVTTILKVLDKPGLNRWKLNQVMMAALTLPKIDGESLSDFEDRAWEDSNKHSEYARNRGTEIHGAVENYFLTGRINPDFTAEIKAVVKSLESEFGHPEWLAERSVSSPLGFGGKVDLHSHNIVVDYKTKDFDKDHLPKSYDEQAMQLAAYRACINPDAICANLYISRDNPGLVHLHVWDNKDISRGWKMFTHLLKYWQVSKGYDSNFNNEEK